MIDLSRRNFLKFLGMGTVGVIAVKLMGGRLMDLFTSGTIPLKNFKFKEKNNKIVFYNASGFKIMTLNQDGELEIGD